MLVVARSAFDKRWLCRRHRIGKINYNHDELGRFADGPGGGAFAPKTPVDDKTRNRLLPAIKLTDSGKVHVGRRGEWHSDIADKLGIPPQVTRNFGGIKPKSAYERGFLDPLQQRYYTADELGIDAASLQHYSPLREFHGKRKPIGQRAVAKSVTIGKADTAEIERLLNQQARLTPQVRRAFLAAVDRIQSQIDVDSVADLLRSGRTQEAIAQVESIVYRGGYKTFADAVTQAILASGVAAAGSENAGVDFSFGLTNPHTLQFLQRYEMNLITGLSQDSLASVRAVIQDGVAAGRNPLDIARDLRALIGLTPRQAQAVLNYRSYLEDLDPAALARDLRDARFDSTIQSALDDQSALESDYIDKVVGRYSDRMLAYRAETISRTEAMRSVNAGNHQLWNQMVNDGRVDADTVVRQWVYTHDGRTRPWHRNIPANNPDGVGLNEPFQTDLGPLMYPGDPDGDPENTINCRCTVVYRTKAQAKEQSSGVGGFLSSLFG